MHTHIVWDSQTHLLCVACRRMLKHMVSACTQRKKGKKNKKHWAPWQLPETMFQIFSSFLCNSAIVTLPTSCHPFCCVKETVLMKLVYWYYPHISFIQLLGFLSSLPPCPLFLFFFYYFGWTIIHCKKFKLDQIDRLHQQTKSNHLFFLAENML